MPYRRDLLSAAALSPLAALVVPLSRARADVSADATGLERDVSPRSSRALPGPASELTRDLALAGGFRVVRAHGIHLGALPFVIEGEGLRFQLDVLRRDARGVSGVHDSESFSVFAADGATVFTAATRVRGARALGAALERAAQSLAVSLSTFEERQRAHPAAAFDVDFDAAT